MEKSGKEQSVAIFIIGDEVLLGEVKDRNTGFFLDQFNEMGVSVFMTAILPDRIDVISRYINAVYHDVDYVILTGGIGPTPDDVTRESVATALGVPLVENPVARKCLEGFYGDSMNMARLKMATVPQGAMLIDNPVSKAPGFIAGKVMVFPGIPGLIGEMFPQIKKYFQKNDLKRGIIYLRSGESTISDILSGLIEKFSALSIGSYPSFESNYRVRVVIRGREGSLVRRCVDEFLSMGEKEGIDIIGTSFE